MVRPNTVTAFPRHVFMRAQNLMASKHDRIGDREDIFDATMLHLTERFHGKEVFVVGSMNKSTMLGTRTKKLIEDVQPDVVLVQSSQDWWKTARLLKYVESQEEFDTYQKHFDHIDNFGTERISNIRKIAFWPRIWALNKMINWQFKWGKQNKPWKEGFEVKEACQAAEATGAKLEFLGSELNWETRQAIAHETRFNLPQYMLRWYHHRFNRWDWEHHVNKRKISENGWKVYTEACMDQYQMNWYIKALEIMNPHLKKVVVDDKDEELFKKIDKYPGKKVVVVVNQWHMEGIEHMWCQAYGQKPRSVHFDEPINPIGDMDLRRGLFDMLFDCMQRELKSSHSRSAPSTFSNMLIGYHRETVFHYEHRDM